MYVFLLGFGVWMLFRFVPSCKFRTIVTKEKYI